MELKLIEKQSIEQELHDKKGLQPIPLQSFSFEESVVSSKLAVAKQASAQQFSLLKLSNTMASIPGLKTRNSTVIANIMDINFIENKDTDFYLYYRNVNAK